MIVRKREVPEDTHRKNPQKIEKDANKKATIRIVYRKERHGINIQKGLLKIYWWVKNNMNLFDLGKQIIVLTSFE